MERGKTIDEQSYNRNEMDFFIGDAIYSSLTLANVLTRRPASFVTLLYHQNDTKY